MQAIIFSGLGGVDWKSKIKGWLESNAMEYNCEAGSGIETETDRSDPRISIFDTLSGVDLEKVSSERFVLFYTNPESYFNGQFEADTDRRKLLSHWQAECETLFGFYAQNLDKCFLVDVSAFEGDFEQAMLRLVSLDSFKELKGSIRSSSSVQHCEQGCFQYWLTVLLNLLECSEDSVLQDVYERLICASKVALSVEESSVRSRLERIQKKLTRSFRAYQDEIVEVCDEKNLLQLQLCQIREELEEAFEKNKQVGTDLGVSRKQLADNESKLSALLDEKAKMRDEFELYDLQLGQLQEELEMYYLKLQKTKQWNGSLCASSQIGNRRETSIQLLSYVK